MIILMKIVFENTKVCFVALKVDCIEVKTGDIYNWTHIYYVLKILVKKTRIKLNKQRKLT